MDNLNIGRDGFDVVDFIQGFIVKSGSDWVKGGLQLGVQLLAGAGMENTSDYPDQDNNKSDY